MNQYYILYKGKEKIDFNEKTFTHNEITNNNVFESDILNYYVVEEKDYANRIFRRVKEGTEPVSYLSLEEGNKILVLNYLLSNKLIQMEHFREVWSEEAEDLNSLLDKHNTDGVSKEKVLELFNDVLDIEEIRDFHFRVRFEKGEKSLLYRITFRDLFTLSVNPYFAGKEGLTEQELNDFILNFYADILKVINNTNQDFVFHKVSLKEHVVESHPLNKAATVLEYLFDNVPSQQLLTDLNIDEKELEYIKNKLLSVNKEYENKLIYKR